MARAEAGPMYGRASSCWALAEFSSTWGMVVGVDGEVDLGDLRELGVGEWRGLDMWFRQRVAMAEGVREVRESKSAEPVRMKFRW